MSRQAQAICNYWVEKFGLGFHPDTRGADYTDEHDNQFLTDAEVADYNSDMAALFALPVDPYQEGLEAMARAGLPVT
jgi:hypothetical protein